MTALRYRLVDVFSARPLAGNALCVVLDATDEALQQPIAREMNLSETTFPTITGAGAYHNRIYTPVGELPFAGHPTLGTAWVLGPGTWQQTSAGGTVEVEVDPHGARMVQPEPELVAIGPADPRDAAGVERADGAWTATAAGVTHLVLASATPIGAIAPDPRAVTRVLETAGATTFAVVHPSGPEDLHVRVFVPAMGVPEDPGTGSAAGPIGVIARALWSLGKELTIHQGAEVGRPCTIEVDLRDPRGPIVGGRVSACAEGVLTLP